jgi:hypothetical protein
MGWIYGYSQKAELRQPEISALFSTANSQSFLSALDFDPC